MEPITRPELTSGQKAAFKTAFEKILSHAPKTTQQLYSGDIVWVKDIPMVDNGILSSLHSKLKDEYNKLINKVKGRTIEKEISLVQYISSVKADHAKLNPEYVTIVNRANYEHTDKKESAVILTELHYKNPETGIVERIYVGETPDEIMKIIARS